MKEKVKEIRFIALTMLMLLILTCVPVSAASALQRQTITSKTKKITMVVSERLKPVMKGKTITWSSNKKSVVAVSSGEWRARKKGTATLTGKYGKSSIKIKVTVEKPSISRKRVNMYVGGKVKLAIGGTTRKVSWKSKNKGIASVSSQGLVSGKKQGTTIVYGTVLGVTYQCTVIVMKKPAPVTRPTPTPVPAASPIPRPTQKPTPIPVITQKPTPIPAITQEPQPAAGYVLNTNTMKFHYPWCSSVSEMFWRNREDSSASRESIIARGYTPCKRCKP